MTDRLTIMSWLEGLAQDDWRECHSDSEVQEIARQTLVMLKEQEAVVPLTIDDAVSEIMDKHYKRLKEQEPVCVNEGKISICACGNIVNRYYHPKFCGFCGKELMWI